MESDREGGVATTTKREQKYEALRALHARPGIFVIPNPWDAGSALMLAGLGFQALATSSAAAACALACAECRSRL